MKAGYVIKYLLRLSTAFILAIEPGLVSGQDQSGFLDTLTRRFQNYCEAYPREEIYVHSDREKYVAGEYAWFRIYLFDRQSNKLSSGSSVAYLEILNAENRPVVQERIRLEGGMGSGQALLPDTLSSGRFMLRAYTNRMKNSMPANCFMKSISIYNALSTVTFMNNTGYSGSDTQSDSSAGISRSAETGIKMSCDNLRSNFLEISISADDSYRAESNLCYLFIQTHGIINYRNTVTLSGENTRVVIPRNMLIPGINRITLFSSAGKPVEERLILTLSQETQQLVVNSSDSIQTRSRELIEYEVNKETPADPDILALSVSVIPESGNPFMDISDYMIFGSEFGVLPDTIQKGKLSELPAGLIDSFLAAAKSNWIDWDIILSGNYPVLKYNYEEKYLSLSGHLLRRSSLEPDSGQYLFLSKPGKKATFQYATTDRNGYFNFSLPADDMLRDIIIQPEEAERNDLIRIEPSFSEEYIETLPLRDTLTRGLNPKISAMCTNYQVNIIYGNAEADAEMKQTPVQSANEPRTFYGKPDIRLIMNDYVRLPVMEEVFYELLDGVQMKEEKTGYEIMVTDPVYNMPYEKPPVLMVDGVIVHDPAVIADLDPELVEEIDVIRARYIVGDYLFYGLINIITYAGDFSSITLPGYAVRLPGGVTETVMKFHMPDYSLQAARESRIPDFRNTLYWNPSVTRDEGGKCVTEFWSSDLPGEYDINIQGVTSDGKSISLRKTLQVKHAFREN
jgi:hypothetical protein